MWDQKSSESLTSSQCTRISTIIYAPAIVFVKLSILLQYLRIFVPNRKLRPFSFCAIHFTMWSCLSFYFCAFVFALKQQYTLESIQGHKIIVDKGHDISIRDAFRATGIFNVISDFAILLLPMPCIYKLQVATRKKTWIIAIFATGFL